MNKEVRTWRLCGKLIVLIKALTGVMLTGIILGVLGFLCAIFLTILGDTNPKGDFELPALHSFPAAYFMPGASSLCYRLMAEALTVILPFAAARRESCTTADSIATTTLPFES